MIVPAYLIPYIESIPGQIVTFIGIIFVTHIVVRLVRTFIYTRISDLPVVKHNTTQALLIRHFFTLFIYLVGIAIAIYTIPSLRSLSVSIFAGAGVLAIVIGFASQQALSNVISGLFIVTFTPYKINDVIQLKDDGVLGKVIDINLRHTTIRTFENKHVKIPNSKMNEVTITNFSSEDSRVCKFIEFSISYDSDMDLAMHIIQEECTKHPKCLDVRTEQDKKRKIPKVIVRVLRFGESSIILRAWAWAKNPGEGFVMEWDLNKSIKEEFDKEGVEIPFPYRTLVMKRDEPKNRRLSAQKRAKVRRKLVTKQPSRQQSE